MNIIQKWEKEPKIHCPDCHGRGSKDYLDQETDYLQEASCESCSGCGWIPVSWLQTGIPQKTFISNKFWSDPPF
ncbi:MAG: hypothetical protein H8E67_07680 [Proteobacteria bacterium]|nr:hypothetical protein [Pseudomonadota bacterium]